ncbi:phosphatidate cytidylyltransferase [Roseibacillus ishigakijimensis]|uniref:Phosphatidate cytidylyltransferase n=1 Tax=Roseibacillus ishigakijimensis TaxID=454146 RepID=A0A934VLL8_9BACT|nr:phosphatidate cytidylyltransferase [Roseibacillus ishigakijimensis]MBK1833372.1 phosphatidate cytidylyltransferase [Roseibacillus ishigakijimensis]
MSTLVIWAAVIAVFVSANAMAVGVAIALLAVLGLLEWRKLWKGHADDWCLWWMILVGAGYLGWWVYSLGSNEHVAEDAEWIAILLVVMGSFGVRFRRPIEGSEAIVSVSVAVLGLIFLGLMFGGGLMRLANSGPETARQGQWFMLMVIAATKFTDMGAYAVGSLVGKTKMIAHISPGKTWEGFLGALVVSQAGIWLVRWAGAEHLTWLPGGWVLALLGLVIALGAVAGDLAESLLKRSLAAKDSGHVLPGIGGVLDLIDSIAFTGPLAWFFLKLVS